MAAPTPAKPATPQKALTASQQSFKTHSDYLTARTDFIQKQISDTNLDAERVIAAALAYIGSTPALWPCDPETVRDAVIAAAKRNLVVGPEGYAWLIPFKENDRQGNYIRTVCQYMLGYKGMLELMRRSGAYSNVTAFIKYANDVLVVKVGTDGRFEYTPKVFGNRGPVEGYIAFAKLTSGEFIFEAMDKTAVDAIRARSKAPGSPAWTNDYDRMALKSVIKRLSQHAEMSAVDRRIAMEDDEKDLGDEERREREREVDVTPQRRVLPSSQDSGAVRVETHAERVKAELRDDMPPAHDADGVVLDEKAASGAPAAAQTTPAETKTAPAEKKKPSPHVGIAEGGAICDNAEAATTLEELEPLKAQLLGAIEEGRIGSTHVARATKALEAADARIRAGAK